MKLSNPAGGLNQSTRLLRGPVVGIEVEHALATVGKFEQEPGFAGARFGPCAQEARTETRQRAQEMPIHFGFVTDIPAVAEGMVAAARLVLDKHPPLVPVRQPAGYNLVR